MGLELQSHSLPVQYIVSPLLPHAQPEVAVDSDIEYTVEFNAFCMVPLPPPNLKFVIADQELPLIASTTPLLPLPPAAIA